MSDNPKASAVANPGWSPPPHRHTRRWFCLGPEGSWSHIRRMDDPTPPQVQPAYHDRHTGLIVFGILEILAGALCALIAPLTFFGQILAAKRTGAEFETANALLVMGIYGVMAVVLIWLGIGSTLARRWARAILLCLGWIGLCIGIIALPAVFFALNSVGDTLRAQGRDLPPAALAVIKLVALATTFFIYIVIPGIVVLFYRSPHVRRTCEVRDPVIRWTDRCPLPVLALCLIKGLGAAMLLLMLPVFGRVFPLAGTLVQGWPARLLWLGVIAFMIYATRGFYRLDLRTWWIYLIGALLLWSSSLATFLRIDLIDYYRLMGLPERQLERMAHNPLISHGPLLGLSLLSMAAFLSYLLYVKRYFPTATDHPAAAGG